MNKMKNSILNLRTLPVLFTFLFLAASPAIVGQEDVKSLSDFHFTVENSEGGVKLSCQEGCAWTELTFNSQQEQAVDQYGMTSIDRETPKKEDDLSNFLFFIERTENGVKMRGVKGTAWTHLTFGMEGKKSQGVNQMGMTSLE